METETMVLLEKRKSPSCLFPSRRPSSSSSATAAAAVRPFEEALAVRLRSLLPISDHAITLSWLAFAVRVLTLTLDDAAAILSPAAASPDLAAHLDSGVALLDAANAAAAQIERLLTRRFPLLLALECLSPASGEDPTTDRLRRARDKIEEWRLGYAQPAISPDVAAAFVRALRAAKPPGNGKKHSPVRRVVYAVEAVSSLVLGAVLAVLIGGGGGFSGGGVISGDFPWALEYEKLVAAVSGKIGGGPASEVEALENAVKTLTDVMDISKEILKNAVEETKETTEKLTNVLEGLAKDVNSLFRTAMSERNMGLQKFRRELEII